MWGSNWAKHGGSVGGGGGQTGAVVTSWRIEDCAGHLSCSFPLLEHKTCIKVMKIYWLPIKMYKIRGNTKFSSFNPPEFSTCWQLLHAIQYLFNLPRAANKNNHFCVCSAIFFIFCCFSFAFHTFHAKMNRAKKQKFSLSSRYNFSCSPPWKIVFQSRKHSWNFIAACFFDKMQKTKLKENSACSKKKMQKYSAKAEAEQNRWTHFHSAIIKLFLAAPQKIKWRKTQRKEATRKWKPKREWKWKWKQNEIKCSHSSGQPKSVCDPICHSARDASGCHSRICTICKPRVLYKIYIVCTASKLAPPLRPHPLASHAHHINQAEQSANTLYTYPAMNCRLAQYVDTLSHYKGLFRAHRIARTCAITGKLGRAKIKIRLKVCKMFLKLPIGFYS